MRLRPPCPCLAPRFIPTCSKELLEGLGRVAEAHPGAFWLPPAPYAAAAAPRVCACHSARVSHPHAPYSLFPTHPPTHPPPAPRARAGLRVHSHISESRDEVAFSASLHPECADDAEVFARAGLLTRGSIMAHGEGGHPSLLLARVGRGSRWAGWRHPAGGQGGGTQHGTVNDVAPPCHAPLLRPRHPAVCCAPGTQLSAAPQAPSCLTMPSGAWQRQAPASPTARCPTCARPPPPPPPRRGAAVGRHGPVAPCMRAPPPWAPHPAPPPPFRRLTVDVGTAAAGSLATGCWTWHGQSRWGLMWGWAQTLLAATLRPCW